MIYSGFGSWYDDHARVVVIGYTGSIDPGNFYQGREGFNIMCLERAEPRGFNIYNQIRHAVGQLGLHLRRA